MKTTLHSLAGFVLFPIALLATAVPLPARAAQSYDNCTGFIDTLPATISTQGTWCLRHDLSTAITSGNAITIATNNVTIDCNGFKLGGLAAGIDTLAYGIRANNLLNLTIRHCNVRGFHIGIYTTGGGGHLIEHNSLDSNTVIGIDIVNTPIVFDGPSSIIRANQVIDTGSATLTHREAAYGIIAQNRVAVLDNTVNGVIAMSDAGEAWAYGIVTMYNSDGSVTGNRVRGLVGSGMGAAIGIYNGNSGYLVVRENDVQGNDVINSIGVRCENGRAIARDNIIAGFSTGIENCLSDGNTLNPN